MMKEAVDFVQNPSSPPPPSKTSQLETVTSTKHQTASRAGNPTKHTFQIKRLEFVSIRLIFIDDGFRVRLNIHIAKGFLGDFFECWSGDDTSVVVSVRLVNDHRQNERRIQGWNETRECREKPFFRIVPPDPLFFVGGDPFL